MLVGYHPTVLYHVTKKRLLPRIRREGLKPHVPGKVWGASDPSATRGKRVVWLTADPTEWRHDQHHLKSKRDPDAISLMDILGHTTDFSQRVESLEVDRRSVLEVGPNDDFGLKVADHAREHDVVFKVRS